MSFLKSLFGAKEAKFVEVAPFGARFEVPQGETMLEAALKNGVPFPHNCTVGSCGSAASKPVVSIAVVLPGGGARGAYEVGALAGLLPALEARGERVSIWCGTSVGAINASFGMNAVGIGPNSSKMIALSF